MINDKRQKLNLPGIILASGSPRRAEILSTVGWEFLRIVPDVDETEKNGERPADYVSRLANTKARAVGRDHADVIVLGADTIVVINEQIIGKPSDLEDARAMIRRLSGVWHEVLTGVAVVLGSKSCTAVQRTRVKFAELDENEVEYLVENGNPLDKAGGYAVQAEAALFIEKIEGDYWNVVGLPVSLVYSLVNEVSANGK